MTFLIGPEGVVYQKDLGEKTSGEAATMTEYARAMAGRR